MTFVQKIVCRTLMKLTTGRRFGWTQRIQINTNTNTIQRISNTNWKGENIKGEKIKYDMVEKVEQISDRYTAELGYNEQLGTGGICSL
jgi:hypothetical protein